jgi:hypothetical protein
MYKIPNTDLIAMDESEYLEHFGVPGMKWGHRKASKVGSKEQHGVTKTQVKSAKSNMKTASWKYSLASNKDPSSNESQKTFKDYQKASGEYYNTKRKFKGKKTRSTSTAQRIQSFKNFGSSWLKTTSAATALGLSVAAVTTAVGTASNPRLRKEMKNAANYLVDKGVASTATAMGTAAGKTVKFAKSAANSGAIRKVADAARRRKKYGKYINTTGFSVASASRMIGR